MRRLAAALVVLLAVLAGCGPAAIPGGGASLSVAPGVPSSGASSSVTSTPLAGRSTAASAPSASAAGPRSVQIPMVMYHVIAAPPDNPYAYLYTTPARFAAEMRGLKAAGYCAISLARAYAIWTGSAPTPTGCRPLILRFDDGYASVYSSAFPVLHAMGWPGNLCQQVQRVGIPGGLSANAIRTMLAAGWDLADHGYTNPELSLIGATAQQVRLQVDTSRSDLRDDFGATVGFYCWPLGYYNARAITAVAKAGFHGALGVTEGDADPALQGWWRLDAIPAWGWLSSSALVTQVTALQSKSPGVPPRANLPS